MRPVRLEMKGFTSFRDETVIDFSDADYFVLVGPTGAGKSTVIDAMCFALYGSVPRYDNRSLVAPTITQGELEARVRFDFVINDETYTAVRVVRRQGKGASTKEARLQKGEEVLAGSESELTEEVTKLIGLSFEHFTRCVVLPQGDFAQFLHDKASDRQEMLVNLLGLGLYDQMRERAQVRAKVAADHILIEGERLDRDFSEATPEALLQAKDRAKRIEGARDAASAALPKLETLAKRLEETGKEVARIEGWLDLLTDISVPSNLADAADALEHATKNSAEAAHNLAGAEEAVAAALAQREPLGDRDEIADAVRTHAQRAEQSKTVADLKTSHDAATAKGDSALQKVQDAQAALDAAVAAQAEAQRAHSAQHLAADLKAGEPCPVCLQPVAKLPEHARPQALDATDKAVTAARKAYDRADAAHKKIADEMKALSAQMDALEAQMAKLDLALKKWPDADKASERLIQIEKASLAISEAQEKERAARRELKTADEELQGLKRAAEDQRDLFEQTRDSLAELKPPPAGRKNLVEDWEKLLAWAAERATSLGETLAAGTKEVDEVTIERDELIRATLDTCSDCGIETDAEGLTEAVIKASGEAKAEVTRIEGAIKEAKAIRLKLKELEAERELSNSLAQHLRANGFERWLVNEALHKLVAGATEILLSMSDGKYSLKVGDKGSFLVIDHHDADQTRPVKTLSGGETFQASLALALSLSDRLIELAAQGSARLESIFLDEGFGTLDPQALGMVASTVENLSAKGRVVGIITHVRELADEIPIQFRVRKEGRSSTIERVGR